MSGLRISTCIEPVKESSSGHRSFMRSICIRIRDHEPPSNTNAENWGKGEELSMKKIFQGRCSQPVKTRRCREPLQDGNERIVRAK